MQRKQGGEAMKRLLLTVTAPPANAPQTAGRGGGRGGANADNGAPRELPSNRETGIDIDRFIGYPSTAFTQQIMGGS
jgi:hypothetical protein